MGRVRVLLTKYAVGAGTLLLAAVLGKVSLIGMAAIRGYPLGELRVLEAVVSVFVLWLGVLFVFGTAMLVSVVFWSVLASVVTCALALLTAFAFPYVFLEFIMPSTAALNNLYMRLALFTYWTPAYYYYGDLRGTAAVGIGGFTAANFLVCLAAAAAPLLAALWLFRQKSY